MSTFHNPGLWGDYKIWDSVATYFGMDNPYEAKCLYVVGIVRHLMLSANQLYPGSPNDADRSLPAFIFGFNTLELLGRCLRGDTQHRGDYDKRIKRGLRYIAGLDESDTRQLHIDGIPTPYDIPGDALVKMRNFTAHGFYGGPTKLRFHRRLAAWMFGAIGDAIQRYYEELKDGRNSEGMLEAAISPLYLLSDDRKPTRPTRIKAVRDHLDEGTALSLPGGDIHAWAWDNDYEMVKNTQGNEWFTS